MTVDLIPQVQFLDWVIERKVKKTYKRGIRDFAWLASYLCGNKDMSKLLASIISVCRWKRGSLVALS